VQDFTTTSLKQLEQLGLQRNNRAKITSGRSNLTQGRIAAAHAYSSTVFARWCQYIPIGIRTVQVLSRFEYIDRGTCPGSAPFRPQNCPFTYGDLDPI